MDNIQFRFVKASDEDSIKKILSECELPYSDIEHHLSNFIVVYNDAELIGVAGLEIYKNTGLLRSLAIRKNFRRKSIGSLLLNKIISYAHFLKIKNLFLITTTAQTFFQKHGFCAINRNEAPLDIKNTEEFKNICPNSAICMIKKIGKEVQYYPKEILRLKKDIPGAKMWAISLDQVMFTYFEVQPNSRFNKHKHESEQITMVLEGELFFEMDDKIECVKAGEVIAIPSNIEHAVFTKDKAVKAVDAWSPIVDGYKN